MNPLARHPHGLGREPTHPFVDPTIRKHRRSPPAQPHRDAGRLRQTTYALGHKRFSESVPALGLSLAVTNLKGVSSMKLHRDLGISQKAAWFVLHRIREAMGGGDGRCSFDGPVEVDEAYFGGKRKDVSNTKRAEL